MERAEGRVDWISTGLAYQTPWNEVVLWLHSRKLIQSKLSLNVSLVLTNRMLSGMYRNPIAFSSLKSHSKVKQTYVHRFAQMWFTSCSKFASGRLDIKLSLCSLSPVLLFFEKGFVKKGIEGRIPWNEFWVCFRACNRPLCASTSHRRRMHNVYSKTARWKWFRYSKKEGSLMTSERRPRRPTTSLSNP